MSERIAILVTGMHRSGTSAIARTLSLLGARLADDVVPPNDGNPLGHWEPAAIVELNDRMLADAGSDLYSTIDIDPSWFDTPRASAFVDEATAVIRSAYGGDAFVVLKDPRLVLLLPVWEQALIACGYRVVHVIPLRHPQEVADSLRRRHLKSIPYDAWTRPRGEIVWLRYMLASVRGSRGQTRCFLPYDAFLEDWRSEVRRIASETGLIWPRLGAADRDVDAFLHGNDFVDRVSEGPRLHSRPLSETAFGDLPASLYDVLRQRGDDTDDVDAIEAEYRRRTDGTRDLIRTLEDLYAVIWAYYTDARDLRRSLDLGQQAEGNLHSAFQQLWSDFARSTDEKGALRQDLTATARRIAGLDKALADVSRERDDTSATQRAAEQHSQALEAMVEELRAELQSVIDDREAVRDDLEATAQALGRQVTERDEVIAGLQRQVRLPVPRFVARPLKMMARLVSR